MNIKKFKEFTLEQYGLLLDFRTHVYLENQYGLNPQYNYDLAETVVTSLFAFWDKHNVNYAMRYNKDQMVDELRSTTLKQQLVVWLESEMNTYYFAELQNRNSYRQAEKIRAPSLAHAKRIARSDKMFQGTVIEIGDSVNSDGFILNPTCIHENGRWRDVWENNQ
jgi:hypothetical protein